MANPNALAQLRDIHLPSPVSWWPLAPGWYLLMGLVILLAFVLSYYIYRRQQRNRAKNIALQILESIQKLSDTHLQSPNIAARINELLRRVALVYYPRKQVAGLHGEAWLTFLNQSAKGVDFNCCRDALLILPYCNFEQAIVGPEAQPTFPVVKSDVQLTALLLKLARSWIKQRGVPCSN